MLYYIYIEVELLPKKRVVQISCYLQYLPIFCHFLDIAGVNHEVWKKIADELSNGKINVTLASIRVFVAKRKSEFLNCIQLSVNEKQDHENVYGK